MGTYNLNNEQKKAVAQIEGPLLILAGAGSGKTSTMTHRIAYMLEQGVDPYNILAVTFTNKAAGEMRDRVQDLVGEIHGMWIMTFHAMCLRILRYHAEVLGYKSNFTVYDESDKKSLIKRISKELMLDDKMFPVSYLTASISKCKERQELPETYHEMNSEEFKANTIYKVYKEYMRQLAENNAMDFDDLLLNGVRVLEADESVKEYYQKRFHYVMVDEYQDTNFLQYKLIKYIAEGSNNLCVVGDDDQCIYQWRGADIRNILDFEKDFPDTKIIKLEQNYRSDANILALANSVIHNNTQRKNKALWTDKEDGEKITYRRCEDEKREAWYIGGEIERLHSQGYNYRDIAILYRKNAQSRSFEEKFSFRGLPYRVLAGMRYYDRKEIKDVTSYMRLVENSSDDVAIRRIINEPKRGIGAKSLGKIISYAKSYGMSIFAALHEEEILESLSKKSKVAIMELTDVLDGCIAEQENLKIEDIYNNLIVKSGYLKALEAANTIEADSRIENIMEFKSVITEFEKNIGGGELEEYEIEMAAEEQHLKDDGFEVTKNSPLAEFLEKIALMAEIDNRDEEEDAVILMTMHSAKGLEFPVVFMPGMENGIFPGNSSMDFPDKLEEERRLCYVGITRAKKKLYLTSAEQRMLYGKTDYTTESVFLDEMDSNLIDGDRTEKEKEKDRGGLNGEGGMFGSYEFHGKNTGTGDGYMGRPENKPFDALKYSKKNAKAVSSAQEFEIGAKLEHPKFGLGMLVEQDKKTMTIIFDSVGRKKIGKGFVQLKKID